MSARFFPLALQGFAAGSEDWDANTFVARLLKLDGTLTDTAIKAITGVTVANPAVYTVASTAGWTTGDLVVVGGVGGTLSANQVGLIQVINGTTFSLKTLVGALNVVGVGAYTSGGYVMNMTITDNVNDIDGARVGTVSDSLASKTNTYGVLDAADPTSMTLNDTAHALVIENSTTSQPTHFQDGKQCVIVAADAALSATTVWVEPLAGAMADDTVLVFSNGVTAQLNGAAAAGARSITVDALSAAIAAGHQAEGRTTNSGFPISSAGGPVAPTFDNGENKIGRI